MSSVSKQYETEQQQTIQRVVFNNVWYFPRLFDSTESKSSEDSERSYDLLRVEFNQ